MKRIWIITLLFITSIAIQAQDQWSLQQCIDYAIKNNIQIKQQVLNQKILESNANQAKRNRLPEVSGSLGENSSFGRSQVTDETSQNVNATSANGGIGASIQLYQGGKLNNTVKQQAISVLSGNEDLNILSNNISLQIAQAYLQILLNKELVDVSNEQIKLTAMQQHDMEVRVKAGSTPQNDFTELLARAASEKVDLVEAKNNVDLALLQLKQLLNIEGAFDIATPTLPAVTSSAAVASSNDIYQQALKLMPEIKKAEYGLQISDLGIKIAKGGYLPTVSLSSSFGSSWYYKNASKSFGSFSEQLNNNRSTAVGLSIDIPIFVRDQNKTNVFNAKVQRELADLNLDNEKLKLHQEVEQAYLQASASYKRYQAEQQSEQAAQATFKNKQVELDLGKASITSYNEVKTNVVKAQSSSLQSKYNFIFKTMILKFYTGQPLEL